ncbi:hypothetical protein CBM2634_U20034 [Cupriavidus taiwanensis]|uniref:Uncharacterized protein n=1 Tax=Cupriavidus taiwanensis TaxID=164546 RepID=A0A375JCI4_9BURK|nr:hypothetical protein CBM2634_U20034 [Cupriavidus taiwanensis]
MDKLQMTVTLSADSAPDLLAYLRQYTGARERSFMLRLLAQRGLQQVLSAGPDALLRPLTSAPASTGTPAEPPGGWNADQPDRAPAARIQTPPEMPIGLGAPAATPGAEPPAPAPASLAPAVESVAAPVAAATTGSPDPLAGLDLGALNEAMARFE